MSAPRFRPDWETQAAAPAVRRGFGYRDTKRREFGAIAYIGTIEAEPIPEGGLNLYPGLKRAGLHHYFTPQASRGGKPYGAGQPYQFFDTAEERDAAVERYLKGAEKRAEKSKARY